MRDESRGLWPLVANSVASSIRLVRLYPLLDCRRLGEERFLALQFYVQIYLFYTNF